MPQSKNLAREQQRRTDETLTAFKKRVKSERGKRPTKRAVASMAMPRTSASTSNHVPKSRAIDTVVAMRQRGQLNKAQWRAAEAFRSAYDTVNGSVGGQMDPDRIKGSRLPGEHPPIHWMAAASRLADAKRILYAPDYRIITMVIGEGKTLEECTAKLYGVVPGTERPRRGDQEEIGRCMRRGLSELASQWFRDISDREGRIRSHHEPGARLGSR